MKHIWLVYVAVIFIVIGLFQSNAALMAIELVLAAVFMGAGIYAIVTGKKGGNNNRAKSKGGGGL
jgi:hypothetical protein